MKTLIALVLILSLVGCGKKQVIEITPAIGSQPTQQIHFETEPTEITTESSDLAPYEEYISTVAKGEYRYVDLDEDGEQELFIYRKNSKSELVIISDGTPIRILFENHLFLCEGNIIGQYSEGSGGSTVCYYKIDNNEAVIVDAVVWIFHYDAWYRGTDINTQNMTPITMEEAKKVSKQYALIDNSVPYYLTWLYSE